MTEEADAGCRLAARLGAAIQRLSAIISNVNGIGDGLRRLLSTVGSFITRPLTIVSNTRELFYNFRTILFSFSGLAVNMGNVLKDLIGLFRDMIDYLASEGL
jgi:hypothetical protein